MGDERRSRREIRARLWAWGAATAIGSTVPFLMVWYACQDQTRCIPVGSFSVFTIGPAVWAVVFRWLMGSEMKIEQRTRASTQAGIFAGLTTFFVLDFLTGNFYAVGDDFSEGPGAWKWLTQALTLPGAIVVGAYVRRWVRSTPPTEHGSWYDGYLIRQGRSPTDEVAIGRVPELPEKRAEAADEGEESESRGPEE